MMPAIISDILQWYRISGIQDASITVPLIELIILFVFLTLCLLLRLSRTGLIIAYLFIYRWGWSLYLHNIFLDHRTRNMFLTGYILFGILVLTLAIVAMMISSRSSSGEQNLN